MRRSTRETQLRRSAGLALAAAVVAVASGCGATTTSREGADTTRGKELFQQKCGACHVLADAGTAGDVGPDLDDGFVWARRRSSLGRLALPLVAAALASGCAGTATSREGADTTRGKELFVERCGACHVLADAGTQGEVGPNLDNAFKFAAEQGLEESTFFEVVLEQMRIPAPPMPDYDEKGTEEYLPPDDRVSIAAYVASVAGSPGAEQPGPDTRDPQALFTGFGCGSCHALEEAGTTGTVGPSLDDPQASLEEAIEQIANGGGGMPAYEGRLTDEQIRILAEYIVGG